MGQQQAPIDLGSEEIQVLEKFSRRQHVIAERAVIDRLEELGLLARSFARFYVVTRKGNDLLNQQARLAA